MKKGKNVVFLVKIIHDNKKQNDIYANDNFLKVSGQITVSSTGLQ